jgi:hypothetical protein
VDVEVCERGHRGGVEVGDGARFQRDLPTIAVGRSHDELMVDEVELDLEAASTVDIRSQVTGELMSVNFTEGQDVTAGQLLFEIDPRALEGSLRQAEAQLAKDMGQSKPPSCSEPGIRPAEGGSSAGGVRHDLRLSQFAAVPSTPNVAIENIKLQLQFTEIPRRLPDAPAPCWSTRARSSHG